MNYSVNDEVLKTIKECLNELESSKGNLSNAIKKLKRAAELSEHNDIVAWCNLQLGNATHTKAANNYIQANITYNRTKKDEHYKELMKIQKAFQEILFEVNENNIQELNAELTQKASIASGGLESIGFIEETYNDFVKNKKGNNGTYYQSSLGKHLNLIKVNAHTKATFIYNKIAFKDAPKSSFDYLKSAVDDKLLDLNPELAEQLMITFKSLNSNSDEELSHSLTTCRRMIENFADIVFPPREELHKGRKVGKSQYINRLWAFIDSVVESDTNKLLAQSHLEYLGKYLESIHKLSNKGVHAKLEKLEAIKTVFHLYLVFADLLDYLDFEVISNDKIDINKASIDELEVLGNINRNIAKEIFKTRITNGNLNEEILLSIKGMGKKTLEALKENFHI